MTPDSGADSAAAEWARLDAALDELIGLPAQHHAQAIERLAGGDEAFASGLRSMAAGLERDDLLLDRPAAQRLLGTVAVAAVEPSLVPGTRLGPWRIIEPIGRGGMGEVYRAERADGPFEQRVAIKLMRAPATSRRPSSATTCVTTGPAISSPLAIGPARMHCPTRH